MINYILGTDVLAGSMVAPSLDEVRAGLATIKRGAVGTSVEHVHDRLGVPLGEEYTAVTEAMVLALQEQLGLHVDGRVGPDTLIALESVRSMPARQEILRRYEAGEFRRLALADDYAVVGAWAGALLCAAGGTALFASHRVAGFIVGFITGGIIGGGAGRRFAEKKESR